MLFSHISAAVTDKHLDMQVGRSKLWRAPMQLSRYTEISWTPKANMEKGNDGLWFLLQV